MSTGIYKITNKINNKVYIGQSVNVEERLREHQLRAFRSPETNKEYNKALYQAIRKYGVENFTYELILKCSKEELDRYEHQYIILYQSNKSDKGYNETSGYDQATHDFQGENHPNHKLSEEDVYYIREQYNNHRDKNDVFEEFQDRINFTGFHKIWNNATWKNIHQDVYTEENKQYYLFQRNSHKGSSNGRAKLTEDMVRDIRIRRKNGESREQVYNDYKYTGITEGSFKLVWYNQNWKHIVV